MVSGPQAIFVDASGEKPSFSPVRRKPPIRRLQPPLPLSRSLSVANSSVGTLPGGEGVATVVTSERGCGNAGARRVALNLPLSQLPGNPEDQRIELAGGR